MLAPQAPNHKHRRRRLPLDPNSLIHSLLLTLLAVLTSTPASAQQQNFLVSGHNLDQLRVPETTPLDTVVYTLKALDRLNENRKFSYLMTGDVFSVNELTGEVRLAKPLDRERQPNITVVVSVLDNGDARSDLPLETRRRTILVEDVDDSWPLFQANKFATSNFSRGHYSYQVELSELAPVGSIVLGEIQATDADEGPNAEIVFECRQRTSTHSACDLFAVESRRLSPGRYSVTIRTKSALDYERVQSFKLTLVARGRRASPLRGTVLETEASVHINVLNVQDEGPVFVNAPYSLSVSEGLPPETRLLSLVVQDGDLAPQRNLSVIVAPGPFAHYFRAVKDAEFSKLWHLETNGTLDREDPELSATGNVFSIGLLAAELDDAGQPVASDAELQNAIDDPNYARGTARRENVTVVVLDLPDTPPRFTRLSTGQDLDLSVIVLNISESLITGSSIPNLDLAVMDMDEGINSRFNLSLIDDEASGPPASRAFALESQVIYGRAQVVLNVLNSSLLDYENPEFRAYRFHLVASKNQLAKALELHVNVIDANDNSPLFDRDQYVVEIAEAAPPGTQVATIKAKDQDSGVFGRVDHILSGPGASKFKVISSEGRIVVNDCGINQCLDFEIQPSFSLNYEARDGGGRTRNVSVLINLIDINDHAPKFLEQVYKRELISDNLSSKQSYISPQLIVKAKDLDGPTQGRNNVTYRITSSNLSSLDVDASTGLVFLSQPLDLNNFLSSVELNPLLGHQSSQRTPDSVSVNKNLHSSRKVVFEAEVVADDNGNPPLNSSAKILLVVKGNRDGAPQFRQDLYQVSVKENHPINKPFFSVQAIDPDEKDSQLRYSIGFDLNDLISVNAISGELSFKSEVDFDDFKGEPYNVTVIATDNNRPYPLQAAALVAITLLDVNNKSPKFVEREYRSTIVEGRTRRDDVVLRVNAVDPDTSAQLNYSIVADQLTLTDRNGQQITLDDIANPASGYLAQMNKIDRTQLIQNLRNSFRIDRKSGAISLRMEPDYSFAASITIQVRVLDLKQEVFDSLGTVQQDYATCTFFLQNHIDRNPVFAPPWTIERRTYNVTMLEELPVGTPIFSLLAKDPTTSQKIEHFEKESESDPKDLFKVDKSGVVSVNRRIDFEELTSASKRLSVSVRALSENFFSTAELSILVVDLNDNAPQFKQSNYSVSISEATSYPSDLLTVSAEDFDSSEFGQVFYSLSGLSSELFSINPKRGVISVRKGAVLDRDTEATHSILVTASDCNETRHAEVQSASLSHSDVASPGCRKSSVFVTVHLLDENDNAPVFVGVNKRGEFEALAAETIHAKSVITQVRATDIDEGANGQVGYEIVRADDQLSRLLEIDPEGFIRANESLSGLGRQTPYRVAIRAYDHGKTARESLAVMLLSISDVVENDGVPKFIKPKPDEVVSISESVGPSHYIYQVQAIDPDEEKSGKVMYKFLSPSDTFEIDPFTGVIKTRYVENFYLDREQVPNYTLIIIAHDFGSPPKQAQQVLTISITDVNDNEPFFDRNIDDPPVVLQVEEELPKNHLIGTIQAIDKDVGENALIGYTIIEGNQNNLFRLSYELDNGEENSTEANVSASGNNACRIYSTGRLDREVRDTYTLTIKASSLSKLKNQFLHHLRDPLGYRNPLNQYNASDLTKIRVTIKLLDINDNRPVFTSENAKTVVDSTAEIYSQLLVLRASDADSSSPEIQYSIVDALYYSDSKFKSPSTLFNDALSYTPTTSSPVSMRHVFDIDSRLGILRNAASLRPYIDGYFEVLVKADSGSYSQLAANDPLGAIEADASQFAGGRRGPDLVLDSRCYNSSDSGRSLVSRKDAGQLPASGSPYAETDDCFTTVTKAIVFVTHQRETFRFVFNKSKLNDRLDEFKEKVQYALEEFMFEPSTRPREPRVDASSLDPKVANEQHLPKAEKVYLNTFNTDFYEREDGSLDFSTVTSCSQLVKFDDRSSGMDHSVMTNSLVPNQVIGYEEVVNLLKSLNATQTRNQKVSLFNQYGLVNIERCLPDRVTYRMSLSERLSLYFAASIAIVGALLALIVSRIRKSYEKNLKLLQRSKYQYMGQYATLAPGMHAAAAAAAAAAINRAPLPHQMSLGNISHNGNANYMSPRAYSNSHLHEYPGQGPEEYGDDYGGYFASK